MKDFKTGDQVEVEMCGRWCRATYISKRPDNGLNIVCINDGDSLTYQTVGDIHCSLYPDGRIRKYLSCCDRSFKHCHCCCRCDKY